MKKDTAISEVIGAVILIAIFVVSAGVVMSVIMTPPERAMPVLDYYGCNPSGDTKCIVHKGGATLYSAQYYLRGLGNDTLERPLVPGLIWSVPGCEEHGCLENFTLEDRICTDSAEVSFIQLIIIDETGNTLHGTVSMSDRCASGVTGFSGGFREECDPTTHLNPYPADVEVEFDIITCTWKCIGGGYPINNSCDEPEPLTCAQLNLNPNPPSPLDPDAVVRQTEDCTWLCSNGGLENREPQRGGDGVFRCDFTPGEGEPCENPNPYAPLEEDRDVYQTEDCTWLCFEGELDRLPLNQGYTCTPGTDEVNYPKFDLCYVRNQIPSKSVLYLSNIQNVGSYRIELVFDENNKEPRRLDVSEGPYLDMRSRLPITKVNLVTSLGVYVAPVYLPFEDPNAKWCPCPDGWETDWDADPTGETCKPSWKDIDVDACWIESGKKAVNVLGGEAGESYSVLFNGVESGITHLGVDSWTRHPPGEATHPYPISSVELKNAGAGGTKSLALNNDNNYCCGTCPPDQRPIATENPIGCDMSANRDDLPEGCDCNCECDPDLNLWEPPAGTFSTLSDDVQVPSKRFEDCECMPGYGEYPDCELREFNPLVCYTHENKTKVMIYDVDPDQSDNKDWPSKWYRIEVLNQITLLDQRTLGDYNIGGILPGDDVPPYNRAVDFLNLYIVRPDEKEGDEPILVGCASGEDNPPCSKISWCDPECTKDYMEWNPDTETCDCPPGYTRNGDLCDPVPFTVSLDCVEPNTVGINWGDAEPSAKYRVTLIGRTGVEEIGTQIYIISREQELPQQLVANNPFMKITGVGIEIEDLEATSQGEEGWIQVAIEEVPSCPNPTFTACYVTDKIVRVTAADPIHLYPGYHSWCLAGSNGEVCEKILSPEWEITGDDTIERVLLQQFGDVFSAIPGGVCDPVTLVACWAHVDKNLIELTPPDIDFNEIYWLRANSGEEILLPKTDEEFNRIVFGPAVDPISTIRLYLINNLIEKFDDRFLAGEGEVVEYCPEVTCPPNMVWNPVTEECECIPGSALNEEGVCEIAPVVITACWSMNPHRQIDIELTNRDLRVEYQIWVNNAYQGLYRPGNDGKMRITLAAGTIQSVRVLLNGEPVPLIFNGGFVEGNILLANRENIPDCLTGTCVDEYANTEDRNKDWANGCRCFERSVPAEAIVKNPQTGGDYNCASTGSRPAGVFCPAPGQTVNIETKADGSCDCEIGYDRVPAAPLTALITACRVRLPDWGQPYCSGGSNNKGVQFYGKDESPGILYEIQFRESKLPIATAIHVGGTRTLIGVGSAPESLAAYLCTDTAIKQLNFPGNLISYECVNKIGPIVYGGKGNIKECTPTSAGVTATCKADDIHPGTGGGAYYGMTVPAHFNVGSSDFQQSCGVGNGCICDYGYTDAAGNTCTPIKFDRVEYCYAAEDRNAVELILPKAQLNLIQSYCPPAGAPASIPYRVDIGGQNQISYYAGSPQTFSVNEKEGKNIPVKINLYRPVYINSQAIPAANKIEFYSTSTMHPPGVPTQQHRDNSVNPVVFNSMATWDGVRYCGCVGEDNQGPCDYNRWKEFQEWVEDCKKTQDYLDGNRLCDYSEYKNR